MSLRDFGLLVLICLVWAGNNIISKIVVAHWGVPPLFYAAVRFSLVALVTVPWLRELLQGQVRLQLSTPEGGSLHTVLRAVDAPHGMLSLEAPQDSGALQAVLDSDELVASAFLDRIKLQFELPGLLQVRATDGSSVLRAPLPAQLYRFQRRQAYRVHSASSLYPALRLADPARFDLRDDTRTGVRGELVCGQDVEIDVNCVFTGRVELGEGVSIGANCCIANARIAAGAVIHPYTHIDGEKAGATVGEGALIGPFARLRPGAQLGREVHIGNFVEVKNSTLADGAKANHLAYLGDATVGERVNYGAGSITANYDGANKHRTVIEADVHIGSNCVLVAPVTIGAGGTVGGGSTITKSTEPGALSVARGKQVSIANWQRPKK